MSATRPKVLLLAAGLSSDRLVELQGQIRRLEQAGVVPLLLGEPQGRLANGVDRTAHLPLRRLDLQPLQSRLTRWWHLRRLASEVRSLEIDLIHVIDPSMAETGLVLAEWLQRPYVLTLDTFLPPGSRLNLARRWCRGVIATGQDLAHDLIRNLRLPPELVRVIRPGIEPIEACPGPESTPADAPSRPGAVPVIGAAGRLASGSGLVCFLEAMRRLLDAGLDAEFLIVGRGPGEPSLRRLAARLEIADRLSFASDSGGLLPYWSVLACFCLTTQHPSTGLDLARALAAGLPTVATAVPGLDAWFQPDVTGLRVPVDDAPALAVAVQRLLAEPELARALAHCGSQRVLHSFDPAIETTRLLEVYRSALEPLAAQPRTAPGLSTVEPRPAGVGSGRS